MGLKKKKGSPVVLVFTRGKQELEDLDDDCRADDTDYHHPHDEEEEWQRLGAEASQLVPEILQPPTRLLRGANAQSTRLDP